MAGTVNLTLALLAGMTMPGVGVVAAGAVLGFFAIGASLTLFMLALRHLGAARTSAYYSLAPFIGAILAMPLLGERPQVGALVGGGLMAIGVWLHLTERHIHEHRHPAVAHEHAHVHDAHHQHTHDAT